jgi:hypothetical protein
LSFSILMSEEYIPFTSEELLTFDQFDDFLESNPLIKAEIIARRLMQHLLIVNNVLYLFDGENVTYKQVNQPLNEYLLTITRKLIVNSFEQLPEKHKRMIRKMYDQEIGGPGLTKLFKLDYYKDFIMDIAYLLTDNSITFSTSTKYITHFRNGYFDLKKNKFQRRNPSVHYVKEYNDEDYARKSIMDRSPMDSDDDDDEEEAEEEVEPKVRIDRKEIKRIASLI